MKIDKHISLILLCSLLYLLLTSCVSSKIAVEKSTHIFNETSVLNIISKRGVLRVGTTGDFMPFSYYTKSSSTVKGLDIELAKDLGNSLDVPVEFIQTSWPTMMDDLKAGKFDICMSGVTIKLSRQRQALFSKPLLSSGKAAITRDEFSERFINLDSINQHNVRVIVNPGGTNESFARAHFPKATIILNEDNLSIFQRIVDGDADLMVTDAVETKIQELIHPELEAVNPDKPFNFFEMGYLLPIDHTFKAFVDQWLNLRQKDGTYKRLFDAELAKIKEEVTRD